MHPSRADKCRFSYKTGECHPIALETACYPLIHAAPPTAAAFVLGRAMMTAQAGERWWQGATNLSQRPCGQNAALRGQERGRAICGRSCRRASKGCLRSSAACAAGACTWLGSPPREMNGQQLTAPEGVFEAIPVLEFDQTANLAVEAGRDL